MDKSTQIRESGSHRVIKRENQNYRKTNSEDNV